MKFGPIIVTTLVILSMSLTACQRKSSKDAAREGNRLSFESGQLTDDLRANHGVNVYQAGVSSQELQSKAHAKSWETTSDEDRKVIRAKLTQLIAKIDRIFQIDRRKDIRVNDKTGSLKIARENAQIYLSSLDNHEKGLAAPTVKEPVFDQKAHDQKRDDDDKEGHGWGGGGTNPTLQ